MAESINYQLAHFVASYGKVSQIPASTCPEVSFVGRSNVGKSSIMNKLFGRKNLVKVSSTPGKTSNINFFEADDVHFVDLPGYGYAKASASERQKIQQVINNYINLSPDLVNLFVLIDSRHDIGKIDLDFLMELGERRIPFAIIFTKGDKQGVNVLAAQIEKDKQQLLEFWEELPPCFVSSSETGAGREEILDYIGSVLDSLGKDDDGTTQKGEGKPAEENEV